MIIPVTQTALLEELRTRSLAWENQEIVLYHGTTEDGADSIRSSGVLLAACRPRREFGRGFYTTTSREQARRWAYTVSEQLGAPPVVTAFSVSREALAGLQSLWFVRSGPDADDFWAFVDHCRAGREAHARPGWYDLVIGPVTRFGDRQVYADYDQVSFHTEHSIRLLNESVVVSEEV